jgi:hypothetical protein
MGGVRRGWEYNIEKHFKEIMCEDENWIHLAQVAGSCEQDDGPPGFIKDRKFLD